MTYRDQKSALRSLTTIAVSQGGYFTARQAEEAGYGFPHLNYHMKMGNFERVGRGLYRIPTIPYSEHDDLLRLCFWSRGKNDKPQAVISHQMALALHDLAEFIPTRIHLIVPKSFRRRAPNGCTLHKATLEKADTQEAGAIRVTKPLRTLQDLAGDAAMPTEQFDRAVEEAVQRGLIKSSQSEGLLKSRRTTINGSRPEDERE